MNYLTAPHPLQIIGCAMRRFRPGERHITRICPDHVLILMLGGVLRFTENGQPFALTPGEYYVQQMGLPQSGPEASDSPVYFYIHFRGMTFDTQLDNAQPQLPIRGRFATDEIRPLVHRFSRLYLSPARNEFALTGLFFDILGSLNPQRPADDAQLLKSVESYILAHFQDPAFSLQALARRFAFSEAHLIRQFRAQFRKTPYRFVTELRIDYAKQLLISTNRTVGSIAASCGYSDYSVFYKRFLRETGKGPAAWRQGATGADENKK